MERYKKRFKESFNSDKNVAYELQLYIENDGDLYRSQTVSIMKNLQRKRDKNIYNHDKAVKLWMYLVDEGAKKYCREFDCIVKDTFSKKIKIMVAKELADFWKNEMELDNRI